MPEHDLVDEYIEYFHAGSELVPIGSIEVWYTSFIKRLREALDNDDKDFLRKLLWIEYLNDYSAQTLQDACENILERLRKFRQKAIPKVFCRTDMDYAENTTYQLRKAIQSFEEHLYRCRSSKLLELWKDVVVDFDTPPIGLAVALRKAFARKLPSYWLDLRGTCSPEIVPLWAMDSSSPMMALDLPSPLKLAELLSGLLVQARREGILSLTENLEKDEGLPPILFTTIQLLVDGWPLTDIKKLVGLNLEAVRNGLTEAESLLETLIPLIRSGSPNIWAPDYLRSAIPLFSSIPPFSIQEVSDSSPGVPMTFNYAHFEELRPLLELVSKRLDKDGTFGDEELKVQREGIPQALSLMLDIMSDAKTESKMCNEPLDLAGRVGMVFGTMRLEVDIVSAMLFTWLEELENFHPFNFIAMPYEEERISLKKLALSSYDDQPLCQGLHGFIDAIVKYGILPYDCVAKLERVSLSGAIVSAGLRAIAKIDVTVEEKQVLESLLESLSRPGTLGPSIRGFMDGIMFISEKRETACEEFKKADDEGFERAARCLQDAMPDLEEAARKFQERKKVGG